jgi:hypothetical protein
MAAIVAAAAKKRQPSQAGRGDGVTDDAFLAVWNASVSAKACAEHFGWKIRKACDRAGRIRRGGAKVKRFAVGRSGKPVDEEDAPVGAAVELPEPTPEVKLDIRPKRSFRLFARAVARGEAKPLVPKVHRVPVEVTRGEVRGHWEALAELGTNEYGTRMMRVRSTCEAKAERKMSVSEFMGGRLPDRCRGCAPKPEKWTRDRRLALSQAAKERGPRAAMPETYRCTVLDRGHPCGSLVYGHKRRDHLLDVHDEPEGDVGASFTGPIETREEAA